MGVLEHAPARRAFLILWGGWTAAALLAAALIFWFHEVGLVLAIIVLVLTWISLAGIELNFRQRHLPREARRPWHAILVIFVLTIPILLGKFGRKFEHYLPGSQARSENCQLRIKRQNSSENDLDLLFKYRWGKIQLGPNGAHAKILGDANLEEGPRGQRVDH